ncbi:MAG TPA: ABC transporter permease, partial [Micromonospora sp.]
MKRGPLVAVATALALVVASQLFPRSVPLGVVLLGALLGTGTGLMAVGLVLTYRTTRIINFSYGAMGSTAAGVTAGLVLGRDVPWALAAPFGVLVGVGIGAGVERFVIRRFATAPRLVLTVATIGLAQARGGAAVFLPTLLDTQPIISSLDTPLTDRRLDVDPVLFNGNDLALLAVVPVVLAALGWFLMKTEAGIAVRGMADNMDRARLLGIPVNRLSMLLWSVAGGLAALTVIMRLPNEGISFDVAAGPNVLLPALAAAVVTGMTSLWGAFVAGMAIGVLDQLVRWNVERQATTYLVLLAVIVIGLLVQRSIGPKARAGSEESSWSVVGAGRSLPAALARLPEVRLARVVGLAAVAALVVLVPFVGSTSQVNYATVTLVYAMVAISLVVLTGWGGVVSLGQIAIVGVGGVVAANLIADRNMDLWLTLGASAVAGGLVALLLGLPALRVSGQLLAVTTLAFAAAMQLYFLNPANYESLLPSSYSRPELWGRAELVDERWLYALTLGLLVASVVVIRNMRRARTGRVIAAARDNDRAAAATGINTVETRLMAFVFAGCFAGLAGA